MPGIADYAEKYHQKHPDEAVRIGFLPSSIWFVFEYAKEYDFAYGERFYDLSWNHGLTHEEILSSIKVPCIYLHAKESISENGTLLCAASREQAERAVSYIGDNCRMVETDTSDHIIHTVHSDDQEGIALVPAEVFEAKVKETMNFASIKSEDF